MKARMVMLISKVFLDVVNDMMIKNGFGRIGTTYYKWMKDEQIVLTFSYEMLFGDRAFRLILTAHAYVDGITMLPGKQKRLWLDDDDMAACEAYLFRLHNQDMIKYNHC